MSIVFDNVSFSYKDGVRVLDGFSLELPSKGVICLFGPSGCGKTTLLRLLAGLETPQEGEIKGLEGKNTAVVFQENRLLPWMSVLDNTALVSGGGKGHKEAAVWLDRMGLGDVLKEYPAQLSGGMKRRVALARALTAPADLLLLDEPFTGLDERLWQMVSERIQRVCAHKPVVMVTHLIEQAKALDAHIITLDGPPLCFMRG